MNVKQLLQRLSKPKSEKYSMQINFISYTPLEYELQVNGEIYSLNENLEQFFFIIFQNYTQEHQVTILQLFVQLFKLQNINYFDQLKILIEPLNIDITSAKLLSQIQNISEFKQYSQQLTLKLIQKPQTLVQFQYFLLLQLQQQPEKQINYFNIFRAGFLNFLKQGTYQQIVTFGQSTSTLGIYAAIVSQSKKDSDFQSLLYPIHIILKPESKMIEGKEINQLFLLELQKCIFDITMSVETTFKLQKIVEDEVVDALLNIINVFNNKSVELTRFEYGLLIFIFNKRKGDQKTFIDKFLTKEEVYRFPEIYKKFEFNSIELYLVLQILAKTDDQDIYQDVYQNMVQQFQLLDKQTQSPTKQLQSIDYELLTHVVLFLTKSKVFNQEYFLKFTLFIISQSKQSRILLLKNEKIQQIIQNNQVKFQVLMEREVQLQENNMIHYLFQTKSLFWKQINFDLTCFNPNFSFEEQIQQQKIILVDQLIDCSDKLIVCDQIKGNSGQYIQLFHRIAGQMIYQHQKIQVEDIDIQTIGSICSTFINSLNTMKQITPEQLLLKRCRFCAILSFLETCKLIDCSDLQFIIEHYKNMFADLLIEDSIDYLKQYQILTPIIENIFLQHYLTEFEAELFEKYILFGCFNQLEYFITQCQIFQQYSSKSQNQLQFYRCLNIILSMSGLTIQIQEPVKIDSLYEVFFNMFVEKLRSITIKNGQQQNEITDFINNYLQNNMSFECNQLLLPAFVAQNVHNTKFKDFVFDFNTTNQQIQTIKQIFKQTQQSLYQSQITQAFDKGYDIKTVKNIQIIDSFYDFGIHFQQYLHGIVTLEFMFKQYIIGCGGPLFSANFSKLIIQQNQCLKIEQFINLYIKSFFHYCPSDKEYQHKNTPYGINLSEFYFEFLYIFNETYQHEMLKYTSYICLKACLKLLFKFDKEVFKPKMTTQNKQYVLMTSKENELKALQFNHFLKMLYKSPLQPEVVSLVRKLESIQLKQILVIEYNPETQYDQDLFYFNKQKQLQTVSIQNFFIRSKEYGFELFENQSIGGVVELDVELSTMFNRLTLFNTEFIQFGLTEQYLLFNHAKSRNEVSFCRFAAEKCENQLIFKETCYVLIHLFDLLVGKQNRNNITQNYVFWNNGLVCKHFGLLVSRKLHVLNQKLGDLIKFEDIEFEEFCLKNQNYLEKVTSCFTFE